MTARSRPELVLRALSVLGVVPAGQTPEDDDYDIVDALVEPLLERLNAEKITSITDAEGNITQLDDPEAIPGAQFLDVAVLLADAAKQDFGLAALPQADPVQSEIRLRTIVSVGATQEEYETTVIDLDTDVETTVTHRRNKTLVGDFF